MIDFTTGSNLLITVILIFSTGIIAGLSPCTLPTAAFVVAYVSGKKDHSKKSGFMISLFFVLGIITTLTVLGVFSGIFGKLLNDTAVLNYTISIILLIMGLWLLKIFDFNINLPFSTKLPNKRNGFVAAYLIGIPFGISSSPCTMPITLSILAFSASKGSVFYGVLLMFFYALGRSLPLLMIGTFTGFLKNIKAITKYQSKIELVSGWVVIGLALYFIWIA
jgi:cytochrome c-type biogenesis protein